MSTKNLANLVNPKSSIDRKSTILILKQENDVNETASNLGGTIATFGK